MLSDKYGRPLKTLRMIVNNECNYRCIYCHREGINRDRKEFLTLKEIEIVAKVARRIGIDRFKITGGEPLLRNDIVDIVRILAELKPNDISMTTNGFYITSLAEHLVEAGLQRINVALPSLNREKYKYITSVDAFPIVIKGIELLHNLSIKPITLNIVFLKNLNEYEYQNFIDFASKIEARLRFIELEPISISEKNFNSLYASLDNLVKILEEISIKKYVREINLRPVYVLSNGIEVEIVRWYKNHKFCLYCDRIRLYNDRIIKPCIALKDYVDLQHCLKPMIDEKCIEETLIYANTLRKPFWEDRT